LQPGLLHMLLLWRMLLLLLLLPLLQHGSSLLHGQLCCLKHCLLVLCERGLGLVWRVACLVAMQLPIRHLSIGR